ncbi:MAG TPA: hypothetical protein VNK04_24000 [Gemmataceae bacterium]|nr:hypothetical protein [Gemmataceae bacterium]
MSPWKWFPVIFTGWQFGLPWFAFVYRSQIWSDPSLLVPLIATWEVGGLAALAISSLLPKETELGVGYRLYLISIMTGAVAHATYLALSWEGSARWLGLLLIGPFAGGAAAAISGMLTSMLFDYGFKKTAVALIKAKLTPQAMGKAAATQDNIWRVVESRFGIKRTDIPSDLCAVVKEEDDLKRLSDWFDLALTAESFEAFRKALAENPVKPDQAK